MNDEEANVIHAAVAAEDGFLDLNVGGEFWENCLAEGRDDSIRVRAKSLKSILAESNAEAVTALVCDVEGAEERIDFKSLPESVHTIIIEFHPGVVGQRSIDRIERDFREMGFEKIRTATDTALYQRS